MILDTIERTTDYGAMHFQHTGIDLQQFAICRSNHNCVGPVSVE